VTSITWPSRHSCGDRIAFVIKNFADRRRNRTAFGFRVACSALPAGAACCGLAQQLVDAAHAGRRHFSVMPHAWIRPLPRLFLAERGHHRRRQAEPPTDRTPASFQACCRFLGCFVQQAQPDASATPSASDTMVLINQLYQRRAIQTRAGPHHHRGRPTIAPGIGRRPKRLTVEQWRAQRRAQNHVLLRVIAMPVGQVDAKAVAATVDRLRNTERPWGCRWGYQRCLATGSMRCFLRPDRARINSGVDPLR